MRALHPEYYRNIFFGFEDGFVSTAGVLFGVATATHDKRFILIAGIITVLVEATSMGAGAYLSEKSNKQIHSIRTKAKASLDGLVMFGAYIIAGTVCVVPYAIFNQPIAQIVSIAATLAGLFLIGYFPKKKLSSGLEVLLIAGIAMTFGYIAGQLLKNL